MLDTTDTPVHVADHLTTDQLVALTSDATSNRRFLPIRSVILVAEGGTAPGVAAALGCSPCAVQGWVARYNVQAAASFDDRPESGRLPALDVKATQCLRAYLDMGNGWPRRWRRPQPT